MAYLVVQVLELGVVPAERLLLLTLLTRVALDRLLLLVIGLHLHLRLERRQRRPRRRLRVRHGHRGRRRVALAAH